jgi:hypothetical protein
VAENCERHSLYDMIRLEVYNSVGLRLPAGKLSFDINYNYNLNQFFDLTIEHASPSTNGGHLVGQICPPHAGSRHVDFVNQN